MTDEDLSTKINRVFLIVEAKDTSVVYKRGAIASLILNLERDAEKAGVDRVFEKLRQTMGLG